ncbi:Polyketide cyclase SnoaL-like domain containing protein [Trema orientale]|uniref:Polyketide cyclase SnoaL-like domain containing protein n=1 Tax=Trema orientale TaxID=63057 RepID=A0A2P5FPJ7_TREOI|nr:Polyketide cyclase SnoaL-like domain containing protein [Trema orientale]
MMKELTRNGRCSVRGIDDGSCGIQPYMPPPQPSASGVVRDFHDAINARDMNKLDQLLSEECHYEDLTFYLPFEGKEGVKRFFSSVIDAMGRNGLIAIDRMTEGEGLTASVVWHLEWKHKEIPFTSGCGLFECEEVNGRLLIRKITGVEEFALKPGDLILKLVKSVTTFFDLYPVAAEAILAKSKGTYEGLDKLLNMLRNWTHSN